MLNRAELRCGALKEGQICTWWRGISRRWSDSKLMSAILHSQNSRAEFSVRAPKFETCARGKTFFLFKRVDVFLFGLKVFSE